MGKLGLGQKVIISFYEKACGAIVKARGADLRPHCLEDDISVLQKRCSNKENY